MLFLSVFLLCQSASNSVSVCALSTSLNRSFMLSNCFGVPVTVLPALHLHPPTIPTLHFSPFSLSALFLLVTYFAAMHAQDKFLNYLFDVFDEKVWSPSPHLPEFYGYYCVHRIYIHVLCLKRSTCIKIISVCFMYVDRRV